MNDTLKNLKHMMSWPVISNNFTYKAHVDHGKDGSPCMAIAIGKIGFLRDFCTSRACSAEASFAGMFMSAIVYAQ
nr:hypothetical protein [Tanacetum cinerariifolium]GFB82207.1 hypothetical protein [Tanacetum cinerariifolium]